MSSTLTLTPGTRVCAFKGTHRKFRGEVKSNPQRGKVLVANPRNEKWILLSDLKVDELELPSPQMKILGEKQGAIDTEIESKKLPTDEQEPKNSLGFRKGSRIHLSLRPSSTGTISHYHQLTGGWWVNWDSGNNYAVPGESLELDPEEYAGFRVGQEVIERKGQLSQRPGKIVRFEKVGNETRILINVGEFEVYSHPDILSPLVQGEQHFFDLVEEESATPFELSKGKRVYCDVSEKRGKVLGWRTMQLPPTGEPTKYVSVRFDDGSITVVPHSELEEIELEELLPIEQKYEPVESWPEGKDVWSLSGFVDSLKEWAGFPLLPKESVDLTGDVASKSITTPLESCDRTSTIPSGTEISETFTQNQVNMMLSSVDGLVKEPPEQVNEVDSITQSQPCFENSCDVSANVDPSSYSWSNLKDLSITDFERGLEECKWQNIKRSLLSSYQQINLERCTLDSESLRCPTPTSGDKSSPTTRAAGQTKCERWFKQKRLVPPGSQLSVEALALLQGFPAHWFHSLSPSPSPVERQDESEPDTSQAEQLPHLKPPSPLNGSNGSGEKSTRKRSPNKRPAGGSLSRCVSVKKGKEYSTYQYNYDIKDPTTKRGWRTVKEGVPRHLSGAIASAVHERKPIREILNLLGKEPRGEINE